MAIHARRNADSWDHATDLGAVAGMIASPRCLEVLLALLRVDRTVQELSDDLGLDVSRVSQCLGHLANAGLLTYVQSGRSRVYGPSPNAWVAEADGRIVFGFQDTRGSRLVFEPSAEELAELVQNDRRRADPFRATANELLRPAR